MSCEFHIGQKVVWLGPSGLAYTPKSYRETTPRLIRDEIYTVRWIGFEDFGTASGASTGPMLAIRLGERTRTFSHGMYADHPYWAERFRPLEERRYDISVFQAMCLDARDHVGAPK